MAPSTVRSASISPTNPPSKLENGDFFSNLLEETAIEQGEERTAVIGMARTRVLFVIVTQRGEDTYRLISARSATRHEEDRYYAGDRETW
jgi:uncharacterized protein